MGLLSGKIDISYLLKLSTKERSSFENDVVGIAACHDKTFFEEKDFDQRLCVGVEKLLIKGPHTKYFFKNYRKQLILSAIKRQAPSLQKKIPELDLTKLAQIIDKHGIAIRDVSTLIKELEPILLNSSKRFNENALYMITVMVVAVCNAKAINDERIRQGLPGLEKPKIMKAFKKAVLQSLKDGSLKFSVMSDNNVAEVFVGKYFCERDTIEFSESIIEDAVRNGGTMSVADGEVFLHELWHFYQDFRKKKLTSTECEVEAYMFDLKYLILMEGYDRVRARFSNWDGLAPYKEDLSKKNASKEDAILRVYNQAVLSSSGRFYGGASLYGIANYLPVFLDNANKELSGEVLDEKSLQRMSVLQEDVYMFAELSIMVREAHSQMILWRSMVGDEAFLEAALKTYRSYQQPHKLQINQLSENEAMSEKLLLENPGSKNNLYYSALRQWLSILYVEDEGAARSFLINEVFPTFFGKKNISERMKRVALSNGISRNRHE